MYVPLDALLGSSRGRTASCSGSFRLSDEPPSLCHAWSCQSFFCSWNQMKTKFFFLSITFSPSTATIRCHSEEVSSITSLWWAGEWAYGINISIIVCGSIWPEYIMVKGSCTELKKFYLCILCQFLNYLLKAFPFMHLANTKSQNPWSWRCEHHAVLFDTAFHTFKMF